MNEIPNKAPTGFLSTKSFTVRINVTSCSMPFCFLSLDSTKSPWVLVILSQSPQIHFSPSHHWIESLLKDLVQTNLFNMNASVCEKQTLGKSKVSDRLLCFHLIISLTLSRSVLASALFMTWLKHCWDQIHYHTSFPTNKHVGRWKGFALPCTDESVLLVICSWFAVIAVCSTVFWRQI